MTISSRNLHNLNIIVVGRSGVGKSTLINSVLGIEIAKTGIGRSITRKIQVCTKDNSHLTLIDTPSIELAMNKEVKLKNEIQNIIKQREQTNDINQFIHCIWHCIRSQTENIDEMEKQFLSIFDNIPIIIVLTRSYEESSINKMIKRIKIQKINFQRIVPVLAKDEIFDDFSPPIVKNSYGLHELINFTACIFPNDIKKIYLHYYFTSLVNPKKIIRNKCNVIILGKSGAGKSTLINSIIGVDAAESGIGRPVTKKIEIFENENSLFSLFDTPGLELNENQNDILKNNILKIIHDKYKIKDVHKHIHCIWYCVRCGSGRIENYEKKFIDTLAESIKSSGIPIYLVLTQCFYKDTTKNMIKSIKLFKMKIKQLFPIVAKNEMFTDFDPPKIIEQFGIDELLNQTLKIMPM